MFLMSNSIDWATHWLKMPVDVTAVCCSVNFKGRALHRLIVEQPRARTSLFSPGGGAE